MLLVTGATGKLGQAVVAQLLTRTDPGAIAVLARDPGRARSFADAGVTVRRGAYDDPESLSRAMIGVDEVLLIASSEYARRARQHRNVIDAARAAGIGRIAFTSRSLRDRARSHDSLLVDLFDTEAAIAESGIAATIFANALYLDTLPILLGGPAVFTRGIRLPSGAGRIAAALRREMGEAIANALLDPGSAGRTYVLSAPRAFSFDDVATALGAISGSSVPYASVSDAEFVALAVEAGVPEPMASRITESFADIREGRTDQAGDDLERLLGRPPASLEVGLDELFGRA